MKLTEKTIKTLQRKMQQNQIMQQDKEPIILWENMVRCSECGNFLTPRKARNWATKMGFTLEFIRENPEMIEKYKKFCSAECSRAEAEIKRWQRVLFGRR